MIKKMLSRIIKDYINIKSGGIWNRNIRSRVKRIYVTFPVSPVKLHLVEVWGLGKPVK